MEGVHENDQVMVHRSYGEAWKALGNFDADFARDERNVRIVLVTDGFMPYKACLVLYSCWPIFAISYNLSVSVFCIDKNRVVKITHSSSEVVAL
jgi:hypothetical protein